MKKAMDLFGEALKSYSNGDKSKFFFKDSNGKKYEHPLRRYFRKYNQFTKIERKIISLSYGNILDVGCGTGLYIPYLMKKGKVLGIDISPKIIEIAKNNGLNNCIVADIFNFKTNKKFDTILLIENNLGMAGTLSRAKKLLKILKKMLTKKGYILTNARIVKESKYYISELYPIYKNRKGEKFKWINFNSEFLKDLCEEIGLNLEIIDKDKYNYLAKISKK